MIKLLDLINEGINAKSLEIGYLQHVNNIWQDYRVRFPDEPGINHPKYMSNIISMSMLQYDINYIEMMQKMSSTTKVIKAPKKCSNTMKFCYYNSLAYMKEYDDEDVDLAWGIVVEGDIMSTLKRSLSQTGKRHLDFLSSLSGHVTLHAFLVTKNGSIIDPTFGTDSGGDTYYYEKVPRSVWKRFKYAKNDPNFDARDFADGYIEKVAKQKYPVKSLIDKFIKKYK